jgi:hypothetical protein
MVRMLDLAAEEGAGIEGIGYFMRCYASILRCGVRVYGPDYAFLVVLTPLRSGAEIDWQAQPLQAPGVEGVRIVKGDQIDTVILKRFGSPYVLGEVASDADKVVIREAAGQVRSVAVAHGTRLDYRKRTLIAESQPVSRAIEL